ncbi:MAG: AAA family ATPase, partial [Candidatus Eremiobacterota bacterium]
MKRKKIPYGISDFDRIRRQNYYYVDKTGFIENIEDSPPYLFFIRPRRFGKSLFLSLMECYYDIKRKDNFEEIFSGTYIYDNPTEERNKYLILKFNFSAVKSDINKIESSFNSTIKLS